MWVLKAYAFCKGPIPKKRSILERFSKSNQFMLERSQVRPLPQIRTRMPIDILLYDMYNIYIYPRSQKTIKRMVLYEKTISPKLQMVFRRYLQWNGLSQVPSMFTSNTVVPSHLYLKHCCSDRTNVFLPIAAKTRVQRCHTGSQPLFPLVLGVTYPQQPMLKPFSL